MLLSSRVGQVTFKAYLLCLMTALIGILSAEINADNLVPQSSSQSSQTSIGLEGLSTDGINSSQQSLFQRVFPQTDSTGNYFWDVHGNGACELTIMGADTGDFLASAIAVGDINKDGIGDLVVGSNNADGPANGRTDCGEVYIFFGKPSLSDSLLSSDADVVIYGRDLSDLLGESIEIADVNGDDTLDIIVGAFWGDGLANVNQGTGEVYIFFGTDLWSSTIDLAVDSADVVIYGPSVNMGGNKSQEIGSSLATGDMNNDGIDDIAIYSPGFEVRTGDSDFAATFVFNGRTNWPAQIVLDSGDATPADLFVYGPHKDAGLYESPPGSVEYFISVATLDMGDVNCDSIADLLIVYPGGGPFQRGRVEIVFGGIALPDSIGIYWADSADVRISGANDYDRPQSVQAADINADGCFDVGIGVRYGDGPLELRTDAGEYSFFFGSAFWAPSLNAGLNADLTVYGADPNDRAQSFIAEDVNNDGFNEIYLDHYFADGPNNSRSNAGEMSVFFRPDTLPAIVDLASVTRDAVIFGSQVDDYLGIFPVISGDITGDSLPEIILGASYASPGGKLFVINATSFNTGDVDGDAVDDACDNCPKFNPTQIDTDLDGFPDGCDNCPLIYNPGQEDDDLDSIGNFCDPDWPGMTVAKGDSTDMVIVRVADIDRDNSVDVVYSGLVDVGLFVAYGIPGGGIEPPVSIATLPTVGLSLDFFDSDTLIDIIAVSTDSVYMFINQGSRSFIVNKRALLDSMPAANRARPFLAANIPSVTTGYFNGDAYLDFITTPGRLHLGDGSGDVTTSSGLSFSVDNVASTDFSGDGNDDFVAVMGDSTSIYTNDGSAVFTKSASIFTGPQDVTIAPRTVITDFDNDGNADFATLVVRSDVANTDITVAKGDGAGGIASSSKIVIPGTAYDLEKADINGDNNIDLVVTNATLGQFQIFLSDGLGGFDPPLFVDMQEGTNVPAVLAALDQDRDGNVDLVAGIPGSGSILLAVNDRPNAPVIQDELYVVGFNGAVLSLTDPNNQTISRDVRTVAGSDYWRLDYDGDGIKDAQVIDYDAVNGLYNITARIDATVPLSMAIGIDGSQQRVAARNLDLLLLQREANQAINTFQFTFPLEDTSSILPEWGLPTDTNKPLFDWSRYVSFDPSGSAVYLFSLSKYPDMSLPIVSVWNSGTQFQTITPLGRDSVFYWRIVWSGSQGSHTSPVFAVYVTSGNCCVGLSGNVNGDPEDIVDIGDLTALIQYLFIPPNNPPACDTEANANGDIEGTIDIGDLTALIQYLFIPPNNPPQPCQ